MESIIRNTVRSILLETRANLAIRPIMKKWWEVAGDHGIDATSKLESLLTMGEHVRTPRRNFSVGLLVPREHRHKVFDNLTKDAQEWVLKHWKTREYFGNMISGVILGVVDSYGPGSNAIGQKYGRTSIDMGTWNSKDKTWVGGMEGYLTIKSDRKPSIISGGRSSQLWRNPAQRTSVRSDLWTRYGHADLKKADSILFHEFQHWFQESVMYTDKRMMVPTRGSASGAYTIPKGRAPEKYPPPAGYIMLALKQFAQGIDWSNPIPHPNADCMMYEITDNQLMLDTLFAGYHGDYEEIWYMSKWVHPENIDKEKVIDFIENTIKLPLSEEGKNLIDPATWNQLTSFRHRNTDRSTVGKFNSGKKPTIKQQEDAFGKLNSGVIVRIVSPSHFKKKKGVYTNVMKPNQFPKEPTEASIKSARYIVFMKHKGYGQYSNFDPAGGASRNWRQFQSARTTINNPSEWEEYWHEFDAESRNYMAMVTMDLFRGDAIFQKNALLSDEEKIADNIFHGTVQHLNRGQRISRRIMGLRTIREELKEMADRIADKVVETVEEYDPYWYKENQGSDPVTANSDRYSPITVDIERVKTDFIDGNGFWRMDMWGGYWNFIHDKVIGEI